MKVKFTDTKGWLREAILIMVGKWHKENGDDDFCKRLGKEKYIDIKMFINDVEMDSKHVFDRIKKHFDEAVEAKSREMFEEMFNNFEENMNELVDETREKLRYLVFKDFNQMKGE